MVISRIVECLGRMVNLMKAHFFLSLSSANQLELSSDFQRNYFVFTDLVGLCQKLLKTNPMEKSDQTGAKFQLKGVQR